MIKTGFTDLPLHYGRAPRWLFNRMVKLSRCLIGILIDEGGCEKFLFRLADPYWFQALSCVLGYDWHSSGTTTVTCATLKAALQPEEHRIAIAGGKGKYSRKTPSEIEEWGQLFHFSQEQVNALKYASRMSAKIDNVAVQDGHPLYHHAFIVDENGKWAIIQQGMNLETRTARRYHWLSNNVTSFIVEPQNAIVCDVKKKGVLNMTAKESEGSQQISTDLVNDGAERIKRHVLSLRSDGQLTLYNWIDPRIRKPSSLRSLTMPRRINWKAVKKAYDFQPRNYEELISLKGIGSSTIRALALISELIYGEAPSWQDPVKYSFCVGGKDGVPFPINRSKYDELVAVLEDAIHKAKFGKKEKLNALKRLNKLGY